MSLPYLEERYWVYFPEDTCIFSDEHLNYFMQKLDIQVSADDDILTKQIKLVKWKKQTRNEELE